jgi:hypothetical protein
MKPKIYNSELLLSTFVRKSNPNQIMQYIRSLNHYIERLEVTLEKYVDIDDKDVDDNYEPDFHDADEN